MSGWLGIGASIGLMCLAATVRAQVPGELKPGDAAPAFKLEGSDGKTYSLTDFKGKKVVVLAWFPKAFTGG
jgi:thioredoxin-dependent peroxiredoxin